MDKSYREWLQGIKEDLLRSGSTYILVEGINNSCIPVREITDAETKNTTMLGYMLVVELDADVLSNASGESTTGLFLSSVAVTMDNNKIAERFASKALSLDMFENKEDLMNSCYSFNEYLKKQFIEDLLNETGAKTADELFKSSYNWKLTGISEIDHKIISEYIKTRSETLSSGSVKDDPDLLMEAKSFDYVSELAEMYKELGKTSFPKEDEKSAYVNLSFDMTPHEIVEYLDEYIIGQERAKKALAVALYNHNKRINDKTGLIRKSNVLIAGPTGTGKTLLAQTLAKLMDVPFAVADATSLTEAGYVGDDVENCLTKLLQAADGDIKRAERGIIYIDEIDKIARKSENPSITRDVSGEGVQQALLKIIEGARVSIPAAGGRKHPMMDNPVINTENILFICGGAFEGMLKEDAKAENKKVSLGFNTAPVKSDSGKEETLNSDMLRKFGMLPELIGRLPVLIQLEPLTREDLVRILREPKNALIKEYKELLKADGVTLEFTEDALLAIADTALSRNTGARGLRSIVENIMLDIMYDVPSNPDINRVIIDRNCVLNGSSPQIIIDAA